jgi:tRNA (guanine26-N2/guanine27-N2)-dimethyltransferase
VHVSDHYVRAFFETSGKKSFLSEQMKLKEFLAYDFKTKEIEYFSELKNLKLKGKLRIGGPFYTGCLYDKEFVNRALEFLEKDYYYLENFERCKNLLVGALEELDIPHYYDLHKVSSQIKAKIPRTEKIIEALEKKGFKVSKTVFSSTGLKTDAKRKQLMKVILQLQGN